MAHVFIAEGEFPTQCRSITNRWVARGTEPEAVATGSNIQLSSTTPNARTFSTHAVSGWIPSLPLRVLYRTLCSV
jgi:hypothetical protein